MLPFKPRKPLDLQVVKMCQLLKMLSFSVNRGSKNHIDKILKCETQRLHNLPHDKQARDRGTQKGPTSLSLSVLTAASHENT